MSTSALTQIQEAEMKAQDILKSAEEGAHKMLLEADEKAHEILEEAKTKAQEKQAKDLLAHKEHCGAILKKEEEKHSHQIDLLKKNGESLAEKGANFLVDTFSAHFLQK